MVGVLTSIVLAIPEEETTEELAEVPTVVPLSPGLSDLLRQALDAVRGGALEVSLGETEDRPEADVGASLVARPDLGLVGMRAVERLLLEIWQEVDCLEVGDAHELEGVGGEGGCLCSARSGWKRRGKRKTLPRQTGDGDQTGRSKGACSLPRSPAMTETYGSLRPLCLAQRLTA